ncbi:MAG: RidA family protein [Planctomycetaceae bacterium]
MTREVIHTEDAPAAVGPYSQAIKTGNMVFTAGQIPLDPTSMKIVEGDIQDQTRQVMNNLGKVLEAAGASFGSVIKTTIFLQHMSDFPKVNEIYAGYFSDAPPARSTVAVAELPLGAHVEIEAVALSES